MRGAVTSHDGHDLLREDQSTRAQNWAFRRGAFTFRQEKNKRFASSGISGHSKSRRNQTKLNGRGLWTPSTRQTSRLGVRLHKLRFEELWLSSTTSSESSCIHVVSTHRRSSRAKRAASEKNPCWRRSTWMRATRCGHRPLCMTDMDGVPDKKLVVVDHQLRKSIAGVRRERAR